MRTFLIDFVFPKLSMLELQKQMDLEFGFYVKFPPQSQLQRSGNGNPGPKSLKSSSKKPKALKESLCIYFEV